MSSSLRPTAGSNANNGHSVTFMMVEKNKNKNLLAVSKEKKDERKLAMARQDIGQLFFFVSQAVGMDVPKITEMIASDFDGDEQIELILSFLAPRGRRGLTFFYQEDEKRSAFAAPPSKYATRRTIAEENEKKKSRKQLFVTDGKSEPLSGKMFYFIRQTKEAVTMSNIGDVVFNMVDSSQGILPAIADHVRTRVMTNVNTSQESCMGVLKDKPEGADEWDNAYLEFSGFPDYLDAMEKALDNVVVMEEPADNVGEYLITCNTMAEYQIAARNPDILHSVEKTVERWICHLDFIINDFNMIRQEKGDSGPLTELEYWRCASIKFSSIIDFIKTHYCKTSIVILRCAKSKTILDRWREIDRRITDSVNEARDNTKFLYSLEALVRPLYRSEPRQMKACLPALIRRLGAINTASRFFNTSERMTSLFIKITNQMVISLKNFLTNGGKRNIWSLSAREVVEKCQQCVEVFEVYLRRYHSTKEHAEQTPGERPFEFSEMYIFGKFRAFCERLKKLIEAATFERRYTILRRSNLENIEPLMRKFDKTIAWIHNLPHDTMLYRTM